jgi:hypothetical protein
VSKRATLMVLPPQSPRSRAAALVRTGLYADTPGTGPEGETCKTCAHLYRREMGKTYLKCALMRASWTGGGRTDVKASAPACSKWGRRDD